MDESPTNYALLAFIVLLVVLYLLSKYLASQNEPNVCVHDPNSSHYWQYSEMVISIPLHCNICHSLLLTAKGRFCSGCGVGCCTETSCWRKANTSLRCKEIALTEQANSTPVRSLNQSRDGSRKIETQDPTAESDGGEPVEVSSASIAPRKFQHHWIAGNLPLNSECEVCEESCGDGPGIVDLRCCWCQRTVHNQCQPQYGEVCDLGEFRQFIVPHTSLLTKPGRTVRHPKRKVVSKVIAPSNLTSDDWTPLIVIGNRKSGSKDTAAVLALFRAQLNPAQVIDLDDCTMEDGLKWCQLIGNKAKQCYCIIAGGDGTISWVLDTVDKMNLDNPPAIALFPLGTGNDLARSLGYGPGSDSSENLREVMRRIKAADVTQLDRWKVSLKPIRNWRFGMPQSPKEKFMQNYLSIGVDALVTYNFHKARESPLYLFPSRILNKLIYFTYGTKDVLERACKNLDKIIEVYMDGEKVELPNIESVVVLNIPCWGAGVKPWTLGTGHANFPPCSYNDKKLEVFCVYSSFHIAQMQVGLSEPHRLGQANDVRICIYDKVPIQIDGEPSVQFPAEIHIQHHKQVSVLRIRREKSE